MRCHLLDAGWAYLCVVVVCLGNGCVSYYVYYLHGYMLMSDYVNFYCCFYYYSLPC